jgi:hypothetical protein
MWMTWPSGRAPDTWIPDATTQQRKRSVALSLEAGRLLAPVMHGGSPPAELNAWWEPTR